MSKLFTENPPKIYFKDSDKVRLADYRARIVREINPRRPDEHEDLVFVSDKKETFVPGEVLMSWGFMPTQETFFTTAERCKEMISSDPSYWTPEKLEYFKNVEMQLWRDWCSGHVYGYIIEKWNEKQREWMQISSQWGMYGFKELFENLVEETDGISIPICLDNEEMKYDFDNTEKMVNEFK